MQCRALELWGRPPVEKERAALNPRQECDHAQAANRRVEVQQLGERMADRGLFSRDTDDQRNGGRLFMQTDLGPEIVFAQMVAVVAREDHDRLVSDPGGFQSRHDLADLRIHEGHGREVSGYGFSLPWNIHLHVDAGLVVDPGLGNIIPVPATFSGKGILSYGKRIVISTWCDEGHMRAHEARRRERKARPCASQSTRPPLFRAVLPSECTKVIAISGDHNKRVTPDDRLLAVRISFQSFARTRSLPLGTLAVESL